MFMFRLMVLIAIVTAIGGCRTVGTAGADYERHKSNRDAYMYQGI